MTDKGFEGPDRDLKACGCDEDAEHFPLCPEYPGEAFYAEQRARVESAVKGQESMQQTKREDLLEVSSEGSKAAKELSEWTYKGTPDELDSRLLIDRAELLTASASPERQRLAASRMAALAGKLAEDSASFFEMLRRLHIPYAETRIDTNGKKAIVILLEDIAESDMRKNLR